MRDIIKRYIEIIKKIDTWACAQAFDRKLVNT